MVEKNLETSMGGGSVGVFSMVFGPLKNLGPKLASKGAASGQMRSLEH